MAAFNAVGKIRRNWVVSRFGSSSPSGDTRPIFSELVDLLNHFVGQQRVRQIKTERLRSLGIDDEFESDGPLNRQVGNFGTLEDLASINTNLPECPVQVGPIAEQTSHLDIFPPWI